MYEFITRDPALSKALEDVNEKDCRNPAKWIKHRDVELDYDVEEF